MRAHMAMLRPILCLVLAVQATATLFAETAQELYQRGNEAISADDLDAAAADFTAAIAQQAVFPEAYANRGYVKRLKGDLDGAIADYTKAIELNARLAQPHNHRGVAFALRGDFARAIADYTEALRLNPKYTEACLNRAAAHYCLRDWPAARDDLRQVLAINRGDLDYPQLYLWIVRARLGETGEAGKELAAYFARPRRSPQDGWPAKIGQFLLGNTAEKDFLAAITANDADTLQARLCEAWYYTGVKRLLAGDAGGAEEGFRECVKTGRKDLVEYQLAVSELKVPEE